MSVSIFKASKEASSCHGVESKLARGERLAEGFLCVMFGALFKLLKLVLFQSAININ